MEDRGQLQRRSFAALRISRGTKTVDYVEHVFPRIPCIFGSPELGSGKITRVAGDPGDAWTTPAELWQRTWLGAVSGIRRGKSLGYRGHGGVSSAVARIESAGPALRRTAEKCTRKLD